MKVLDRYIFAELLGPFLVGVLGFILVMAVDLLFTMADLIINKGIPAWAVLKLLLYKLPSMLVLTFPVSTLFATAMALGRFSKDSEIVALRTSGVSIFRVARPILVLGLLIALLSYFTNEKIVPRANYAAAQIIQQIIYKQPLPDVQQNIFFKDNYERFYYVGYVNNHDKIMENIMVYEMAGEVFPRVITARQATFGGDVWELKNGVVHKYADSGYLNYAASFESMRLDVSRDFLNFNQEKTSQDMSSNELRGLISRLDSGGMKTAELRTELLMKYSIPLTCFVFALIGIPFSLPSPRAGRTWGMVMTIVCIFTFYVFASVFRSLGKGGLLSPYWAAFTPQISFGLLGLLLLWREGRRR